MIDVELRHLRTLVALDDHRHFGRAADELRVAQPALSQQLQRMERALGVALVYRDSRHVSLTAAGEALAARARALLAQAERDLDEARQIASGYRGRLDVGFVSSALALGPLESVRTFRGEYPGVEVVLHEGFTAQLIDKLLRGEVDLATVRDPGPQPGIDLIRLTAEPFRAVVPHDHRFARRTSVRGTELSQEPFILFPRRDGAAAHQITLQALAAAATGAPNVVQEASSWMTILHLVGLGFGVTVAPLSATRHASDSVRVLTLRDSRQQSTLYLARRSDESRETVRRLCDLTQTRMAGGADGSTCRCNHANR